MRQLTGLFGQFHGKRSIPKASSRTGGQSPRKIVQSHRIGRCQFCLLLQFRIPCQIAFRVPIVWIDADGFLILADGLVQPAFVGKRNTEVEAGIPIIRVAVDGPLKLADRLSDPTTLEQRNPQIDLRPIEIRLEIYGCLKFADGPVEIILVEKSQPKVGMRLRMGWFEAMAI